MGGPNNGSKKQIPTDDQIDILDKYPDLKYHVETFANYPLKDEALDGFALSCYELGRASRAKEQEEKLHALYLTVRGMSDDDKREVENYAKYLLHKRGIVAR